MDFSERFSQALQATLGMEMHGQLGEPGLVRFSPSTVTFGTEELEYRDGVYSFYQYERASRDGASFKSSSLHVMEHCLVQNYGNPIRKKLGYLPLSLYGYVSAREGWILVRRDLRLRHDYWGVQNNSSAYYPCRTHDQYLLAALSYVVEYPPLDVLECYLRPDAGPLLSHWVDREWTPEAE